MSRKVIIVGHVGNHIGCSAELVSSLSKQGEVEVVKVKDEKELIDLVGTDCSAVFPPDVRKFDLDVINPWPNPLIEVKENKTKGHQRPYKYHR